MSCLVWKLSGFNRNKINSIANRIIVSKKTNRSISNINPAKYIGDIVRKHLEQGNTGDLNRRFDDLFIPYSADDPQFFSHVSNENFNNFLHARATKIICRIKEVVGDSWNEKVL